MVLPVSLSHFIGAEGVATLREMVLAPRDLAAVVPEARPGDDVVVLVHGFCATAGVFRPLRARLERETGARTATFTHAPGVGIRRIARNLAALVDRIPRGARITIVGHSLGGVVARWYVQEMSGSSRVERTISLASPFGGVEVPQVLVGADLHERSPLLRRIRERAPACAVPHTSMVAGEDRLVPGVKTACLGVGDVVVLEGRGHNTLLFDHEVAGHVIERVRASSRRVERENSMAL
jgi:antitoxin (DNA-binding transcriptional repressor) of toxin-antitoxin stability system